MHYSLVYLSVGKQQTQGTLNDNLPPPHSFSLTTLAPSPLSGN